MPRYCFSFRCKFQTKFFFAARQASEFPRILLPIWGDLGDPDNMQKKGVRVLGPYANGKSFRLVVIDGAKRKALTASTLEEALALKSSLEGEIHTQRPRTVGEALAEFIEYRKQERGIVELTVSELHRLTEDYLPASAPLFAITKEEAARLYRQLTQRKTPRGTLLSPSTHHVMLRRTRAFFRWTVERGYLSQNPFAHIRPLGQSRAGKIQLTIDEARLFKELAIQQAASGDVAALGVLLLLLLGLRAGEVLARQARDLDDDARVLWITRGKTKNARRRLEVPLEIQEPLRRLVLDKAPHERIFGSNRKGEARNKAYLWFKVRALCDAAGVPRVCSHSLRGLHATLALEAGATPHLVAAALGHGSFRVTARHYAEPSTLLNSRSRRVAGALGTAPLAFESADVSAVPSGPQDELSALLQTLSPEERARLYQLLSRAKESAPQ